MALASLTTAMEIAIATGILMQCGIPASAALVGQAIAILMGPVN
jgi:hypothetical protein